jgi:hypothetical protein
MPAFKILLVYYSRIGNTRQLAEAISRELPYNACDVRQYCRQRRLDYEAKSRDQCCRPVAGLSRMACVQLVILPHRP